MSGGRLLACMVICGLVGACGAKNALQSATPAATTPASVREALRDPRGLPDGLSVRPGRAWKSPVRPADEHCRRVLAAVSGDPPRSGLRAHAAVTFQGEGVGETGGASVAGYRGGYSYSSFDVLSRALARCERIVPRGAAAGGTRFTVTELPVDDIDDVGDEVVAGRLRGRLNGYPYEMRVVFVRSGPAVISVAHAGMGRLDPDRTERLVRAVAEEVAGRAE